MNMKTSKTFSKITATILVLAMMFALLPAVAFTASAVETTQSFVVKFVVVDGTLLFSEEPTHIITSQEIYGGTAYVFPVGTKVAQRLGSSLIPIYLISNTTWATRANTEYIITLTEKMRDEKDGVRIVSTNMGRGLLTVFVGEVPNLSFEDAVLEIFIADEIQNSSLGEEIQAELIDGVFIVDGIAYKVTGEEGVEVVKNNVSEYTGDIVIPSTVEYNGITYNVTNISQFAFHDCTSLTSVTIPDSVTSIGSGAFYDCTSLTSITMPNNVISIGEWAFYDCTSLTSITMPNNVTSIGEWAFSGCTSLTSVTIPDSVTSIGSRAFSGCTSLSSITIGNGVTNIGDNMFSHCTSLSSITIPDSVTSIGDSAFFVCTSLTSITIGNGVTSIGSLTFRSTGITSIVIPKSVTTMEESFSWNTNLKEAIFEGNAPDGDDIFAGTSTGFVIKYYEDTTGWTTPTWNGYPTVMLSRETGKPVGEEPEPEPIEEEPDPEPKEPIPAPNLETAADWAHVEISSAVDKGFVPEDIQDKYSDVITRQEFCRMAVMFVEYSLGKDINTILAEKGLSINKNAFSDTDNEYILAAAALGITYGTRAPTATEPGLFSPNGQFSRQEAATMIMRVCRIIGMDVENPPVSDFVDMDKADSWAHQGINFVRANGIMNGTSVEPPIFSPKSTYTRQQSIITFDRIG